MSKVILVANLCESIPVVEDADYIGVDKGAFLCMEKRIPLLYAIGDFDSLNENQFKQLKEYTKIIQLHCEKNETDGEYAIRFAHEQGYDEIEIYGITGGRQDHFIAMINLLKYSNIPFTIKDDQNNIYSLTKGVHEIIKNSKYISFFACEPLEMTMNGVKYPLQNKKIIEQDIYLVSNEILKDIATINISGKILVFECNDK